MKAEQPEKTHLEESARSETQLHSPCPLLAFLVYMLPTKQTCRMIDAILIKIFSDYNR